jgi:hypothetical protein
MNELQTKALFWIPRVLCLLFAAFLSVFALDVFTEGHGFWGTILALFMHLIPTGMVLAALAVAWRWEWAGAFVFLSLGGWYLFTTWGRMHWTSQLVISGSLFLIGALFVLDWLYRRWLRLAA